MELAAFLIVWNTVLSVGFSFYTPLALYLACPLVPRCLGETEGQGEDGPGFQQGPARLRCVFTEYVPGGFPAPG